MYPLLVFFDLETTGLNLEEDEIVQIAALANTAQSEEFSVFVLPNVEMTEGASNVNGITIQNGDLIRNGRVLPSTDMKSGLKVVYHSSLIIICQSSTSSIFQCAAWFDMDHFQMKWINANTQAFFQFCGTLSQEYDRQICLVAHNGNKVIFSHCYCIFLFQSIPHQSLTSPSWWVFVFDTVNASLRYRTPSSDFDGDNYGDEEKEDPSKQLWLWFRW